MPGFMKVIGHATAALLIEVETGQLYARHRAICMS
jgi:hypothetical protein